MDEIVKQAMAKWPDVPHCYGWLALDARGNWRLRDDACQRAGGPGDKLTNPTLVGFINRNYLRDERGCWYFQNGPQRVYVNLEATPFIARTSPEERFLLQTGEPMPFPRRAFMTDNGQLILQGGHEAAQVDDRDVAQLLASIELDGTHPDDEHLMAWLEGADSHRGTLQVGDHRIPLERIKADDVPRFFGFVRIPAP